MIVPEHISKGHIYTHRWFLPVFVALLFVVSLLNGCGTKNSASTGPAGSTTSFAFISNMGSGTVSAFAINNAGGISAVSGSPFTSGAGAEFMAMDQVHKFLFVSNQDANTVSAFSVNTGAGILTAAPGSPFAAGATPHGVAVDPLGKFVFVGNENDNTVSVFSINSANGALTQVPGSPFTGATHPFGLTVSPSGTLLFVSSFNSNQGAGNNTVSTFTVDATTGALTPVAGPFATSSPAGITAPIGITTDGKFLFVGNHMAESVVALNIASSGTLTSVAPLPSPAPACSVSCHNNPLRLAVDPQDKFIYWGNVQAGTLATFNINNGNLAFVSSVPTGQHPFGLAFDPSGSFLFVINKADNSISAFSVNSNTGMVSPVQGSPFAEGSSAPTDIVIVAKQ